MPDDHTILTRNKYSNIKIVINHHLLFCAVSVLFIANKYNFMMFLFLLFTLGIFKRRTPKASTEAEGIFSDTSGPGSWSFGIWNSVISFHIATCKNFRAWTCWLLTKQTKDTNSIITWTKCSLFVGYKTPKNPTFRFQFKLESMTNFRDFICYTTFCIFFFPNKSAWKRENVCSF